MKTKFYKIEIEINCSDESGFESSLGEAVKGIRSGNVSGLDGNDEEEYSFSVTKSEK